MTAASLPASQALLELRDVDAGYGPFRSLFGVSLAVRTGGVLALLGSNGSGKTTIARVCSGLIAPTGGKVVFDGGDLTGQPAYRYARLGIVHAPEGRSVFATLSVQENLELTFRRSRGRAGVRAALDQAYELFPRLGERRSQTAGTLSGGEQRMLSLARVLVERPRLLIADELSLGLAPIVVDEVYRTLATIRDSGTTLLIVEQHVHHALALADDAIVLSKGEVAYAGPVSELGDLQARLLAGLGEASSS
jgi:branched-chain amino acid transport system ATP-binding protein